MQPQHVRNCAWRATPLSFDVSFLENPCEHPHKLYTLAETKVIGLSVFNFTQVFSKAKKRCSRRVLTRDPTVRAEDLHRWQYVSIFIILFSRNYFPKSLDLSQMNRRENRI